jgi:methionyl-tRNA synthetase
LQDLCVSRTSFDWGVKVPFDPKHVVYVWIDALSNYITALGYDNGKYNDFEKFWPADVHMVAKDIMRFHALIWPAMLMALELPLPKHLAVHGWITFNGDKMSKSKGNVVDPFILGERYGCDAIRYHILREMALGADSDFSNEILINRINSDLANGFGNLVSRTVAMVDKYFGGTLPTDREAEPIDDELKALATSICGKVDEFIDNTQIKQALETIFTLVDRANKYIDETTPWVLGKDESKKARLATVLYNLLESIRITSTLLSPYMPTTMPKVWEQIGAGEKDITYENASKFDVLPLDVTVHKGEILFPRIDVDKEIEELNAILLKDAKPENSADASEESDAINVSVPTKAEITYDDFAKLEFRVGEIIKCEEVPKSKKLLCSQVKIGNDVKQILSGIKTFYSPEEMVGKKVMVVVNLKPATLAGMKSEGMLLCAEDDKGNLALMTPEKPLAAGSEIC